MFETQSGGGGLFGRKKRRYGYGDDDGSTPLSAADHDALAAAFDATPVDQIPQKRDFTLFQPVEAPQFSPQMPKDVDDPPSPADPAQTETVTFFPQMPKKQDFTNDNQDALLKYGETQDRPQQALMTDTGGGGNFAPVVPQLRMNETVETAPPIAPTAPTAPAPVYGPRDRVRQAEDRLSEIQNREYGFKKYRQGDQLEPGQTVDKKGYIRDADGKKIPGKDRDKTHNFWDFLRAAGLGALGGLQAGGLGGAIVGAGIGGVGGIIDRNFDDKLKDKMFGIPKAQRQLEQARQAEEADTRQRVTDAQVRNIDADNQYQRDKMRQDADSKQAQQLEQKRKNWYARNKYFDPAKATEAQRRELAEFGETPESVGKFDMTKPEFKQIAGQTFKWSPTEQAFVDTNLPADKSKSMTEITVKDPTDGKSYTFVTTSDRAAGMLNSRQVAGLQIEAAKDRQISQQTWQSQENEKNRQQAAALARERMEISRQSLAQAKARWEDAVQRNDEKAKRQAEKELRDEKARALRLKTFIKSNKYTKNDTDLLDELDDLDQ
ncbi:MAG: hypothetical protein JSS81_07505 [Acidobacteria bacterium]|nr:hypothetical protein [Acidobacteriota bacterium]